MLGPAFPCEPRLTSLIHMNQVALQEKIPPGTLRLLVGQLRDD